MAETQPARMQSTVTAAVVTIAVFVVLFAMREAKAVVVPALLALFLAVVADSPVSWFERKGLHRGLAILLVVTGIVLFVTGVGVLVGSSLQELSEQAPAFRQSIRVQLNAALADWGFSEAGDGTSDVLDYVSPASAFGLASAVLTGVRDLFGSAFLILFLMVFMLFEIPSLRDKLETLGTSRPKSVSIPTILRHYLVIKTLTSLATGVLVGILLSVLSIDYAVLWGLLAFLLNFIPQIGSFVASIPAVLVTIVQHGPGLAVVVAFGYLAINLAIGGGVEPRVMGKGLGLSTLVVFLSLILWGWLLGPVGMLLSVPLTTAVKIALESQEKTRPIAVLLGRGRTLPMP